MARPKLIEDTILLHLIKQYFDEECNKNIKKIKLSNITRYINSHGYPDYPASTLRRTQAAVDYIEELKTAANNDHYITVAAYQTIDAASMVDTNRSRDKLIRAISERDCYYKKIADSATYHFQRHNELKKEYDSEKENNAVLAKKIEELEELATQYKSEIKRLTLELKIANKVVDTYVYPEIANELLKKEGAVRKTENILKDDTLKNNILDTTTMVRPVSKSGSTVIEGLFDL